MSPDISQLARLDLDRERLLACLWRMQERVVELGLERFDPTDVLSHPLFLKLQLGHRRYNGYYALRLVEFFTPFLCRRLLGVQPTMTPTTFYHLGLAYLEWEVAEPQRRSDLEVLAEAICERALQTRLAGEFFAWRHPYSMHKGSWARPELRREGVPDSCCHHTSRVGRLLLEVGLRHDNKRFIAGARSAVNALLEYHNWRHGDDGVIAVTYYPDTDDETINTSAEVASLFACLPYQFYNERIERCLQGLVQLLISEQEPDGGWRYASRDHERRIGRSGSPDNHHTAMNLAALADVLHSGKLTGSHAEKLVGCLRRGLQFYQKNFVRADGTCFSELGQRRAAEIASYCEGLKMFIAVARLPEFAVDAKQTFLPLMPRMLERAFQLFYDRATGDVACSRRFGRSYHIRSIRWGAGLLMDATAAVLACDARATESTDRNKSLREKLAA